MIACVLKTDADIFDMEQTGKKPFMFRKNDRNFQKGDLILSRQTQYTGVGMRSGAPLRYTGKMMLAEITLVFSGPFYTLPEGSVIMAFRKILDIVE